MYSNKSLGGSWLVIFFKSDLLRFYQYYLLCIYIYYILQYRHLWLKMLFLFDLELGILVPYWFLSLIFVTGCSILRSSILRCYGTLSLKFFVLENWPFYLRVFDQVYILEDSKWGDYFKCMITFCLNFTGGKRSEMSELQSS